jgi:hypothetical protein
MKQLFGLLFLLFDLDNLNASITTTGWADLMGQSKLVTLRTRDQTRRLQGVMGAPLIPTCLGYLSLR